MLVTPFPIVMLVRLLQSRNAYSPMLVTLSGIVMLVRLLQSRNAYSPMLVTPFGITTAPSLEEGHANSLVLLESSYTSPSSI